MKKLTAGIFTVLMGLVSVNAADAAVASKGYVTQEINKVDAKVTAVDTKVGTLNSLHTTDKTDVVAAINELKGNLNEATGGATGRLDAIEESLTETGEVGSKIKANADAIGVLNGTGADSVAGKIAAAVKVEEEARKAADEALQGEIDAAEVSIEGLQATLGTLSTDSGELRNDLDTLGGRVDTLENDVNAIEANLGEGFDEANTVASAIGKAQSAAEAAQADADALEALVGDTAVSTQIDSKIAALDLANTYDAKGAAADAQTAAATDATAKANAAQTNAVNYTDSVVSGLNLSDIARVPASCSKPVNYCALTTNGTQFVWEVIERGVEEDGSDETVPATSSTVVKLNEQVTAQKPEAIQ